MDKNLSFTFERRRHRKQLAASVSLSTMRQVDRRQPSRQVEVTLPKHRRTGLPPGVAYLSTARAVCCRASCSQTCLVEFAQHMIKI